MITYSKETLKRWASECIDVEFYKFIGEKESIHTDSVRSIDVSWEDLPEDVECEYLQADEEDYNNTLYANVGENADYESWYGDKNVKVMIIVLPWSYGI